MTCKYCSKIFEKIGSHYEVKFFLPEKIFQVLTGFLLICLFLNFPKVSSKQSPADDFYTTSTSQPIVETTPKPISEDFYTTSEDFYTTVELLLWGQFSRLENWKKPMNIPLKAWLEN